MKNNNKLKSILSFIAKLIYYAVITFICILVGFLLYYIISSQLHANDENYKPKVSIYTIVSPSMTPVINVYDVVVNVRVDNPQDIQVGDIITYKSAAATSEGMTITHRVTEISQLPDGTYEYMTQGDNNSEPDSLYVTFDTVIGKEVLIIPYLGKVQFLIANQKGWLFLLLIPVAIYLIREIFKLIDLFGLRRKVNKVVGTTEDSILDKKKAERLNSEERKEKIKAEIIKSEAKKDSKIRSEKEPDGFLEKYNETIVNVKINKYSKYQVSKKEPIEDEFEDIKIPTKVDTKNVIKQEKKEEKEIILPKEKEEKVPKNIIVPEQPEILDTDDLTSKIKEYDSKLEKLDKMLKDIENMKEKPKIEDDFIEEDNFLMGDKIKVVEIIETKNKKRPKNTTTKKDELKNNKKSSKINLENTLPNLKITLPDDKNSKNKENKTKANKSNLNLNPKEIKKINRSSKKQEEASKKNQSKKLNLNPKEVKKINRPNKKKADNKKTMEKNNKKSPLIVIEKRK